MTEPKTIPWKRLAVETAAIVVSILMAFWIDAWWDIQKTNTAEQQLLATLESDLEKNGRMAAAQIERASKDRAMLQRFVAMTPSEAGEIPPDTTWSMFRAFWRPATGELNSTAVIATLESSPTLLRSDPELRAAIAKWRGSVAGLKRQSDDLQEIMQEVIDALAVHPELHAAFAELDNSRTLSGSLAQEVREDNDVMRVVVRKGFATQIQIQYLTQVEEHASAAIDLLRTEDR
jgi:hypothetical protein